MEKGQLTQLPQLGEAKHDKYVILILTFGFPLIGCLSLYFGINGALRVMTRSEDPAEFSWLVPVCCVVFMIFLMTSYFRQVASQNGSRKQAVSLVWVNIILAVIIGVLPYLFADAYFSQFFDSDSTWLKSAITAYLQFAASAILFAQVLSLNTRTDRAK